MWLLEREVLAILEISRQSVYNLRKAGILPFYKLGNKTRYKKEDVDALVKQRTTPVPQTAEKLDPPKEQQPIIQPPVAEKYPTSDDDYFI